MVEPQNKHKWDSVILALVKSNDEVLCPSFREIGSVASCREIFVFVFIRIKIVYTSCTYFRETVEVIFYSLKSAVKYQNKKN